ncbi:metallophosphoesterase [Nakamurella antarctica]|uniref:Metallophosphoesterase n=1 Tax=Nakamurella antarctica TaxID=1902245 RepID=A0A3G8ZKE0_9ACTN|nr:metallophosphoesterase [Nakamurella antarctica]AZI57789.1 metallophosphoesterase [Nakamurella antarctica]
MRIHVVADVHGNYEALARAAEGADQLIVLGDLIDYVDYHDPGAGILGAVFGADRVKPFVEMRTVGNFRGLHAYHQSLWATVDDPAAVIEGIVADRYQQVVALIPENTLLTLGNVDVEHIWAAVAPPALRYLDAEVRTLGGVRFGFVAGGSGRPGSVVGPARGPWKPFVRDARDYQAAVDSLFQADKVDVLCTHIPLRLAGMRYDRIPGRLEMYGPGLLEAIDVHQPRLALSGHVHQPLTQRVRRGHTECVNVGHFQRAAKPYVLQL